MGSHAEAGAPRPSAAGMFLLAALLLRMLPILRALRTPKVANSPLRPPRITSPRIRGDIPKFRKLTPRTINGSDTAAQAIRITASINRGHTDALQAASDLNIYSCLHRRKPETLLV